LVHFTLTNPEWQPPADAEDFVAALRTQARRDANQLLGATGVGAVNPLYSSLHSVSSLGVGVCIWSLLSLFQKEQWCVHVSFHSSVFLLLTFEQNYQFNEMYFL
jgi:hypothetical protein